MHSFEFTQLNPSMAWKALWQYFTPTKTSCRNSMFASILTFLSYISSLTMFSLSYRLVLQMASTVNFQNGYTSTSLKKCIVLVTSATMKNKWPYGSSARRQSSCVVPTSTGCWNSLSWHQPIPHVVSMDITWTQTQRWKGQMLSLSMHFPSSLSKKQSTFSLRCLHTLSSPFSTLLLHMVRPCSSQPLSCFCATTCCTLSLSLVCKTISTYFDR